MITRFRTGLAVLIAALFAVTPALADAGWQKLLTPAALAEASADVTVLDIRSPKEYATAHVPGAINAPYPVWRGPAQNPGQVLSDAQLTQLLQALGLTPESRVVVVHAGTDETDFGAAARVYWTLKSAGLGKLAILNGGVRSWVAAGQALSVETTVPKPSTASFALADTWMAGRAEVAGIASGERDAVLVDARPEAFFKAERKHPAAKAAGTLPGAKNVDQFSWFDGNKTELPAADRIAALAKSAGVGAGEGDVVSFCNTGHWAATSWFAMSELAGIENVKMYPESMVGWVNSGGAVTAGE